MHLQHQVKPLQCWRLRVKSSATRLVGCEDATRGGLKRLRLVAVYAILGGDGLVSGEKFSNPLHHILSGAECEGSGECSGFDRILILA